MLMHAAALIVGRLALLNLVLFARNSRGLALAV
jgi:hypothetical protein